MNVQEVAAEAVKAAPPISVSGLAILGYNLDVWVLLLTGLYTILQVYFLLRDKWWRQRNEPKK